MTVTQVKVSQDNEETLDNINDCSTLSDTVDKLPSDIDDLPSCSLETNTNDESNKSENTVKPKRKYVKTKRGNN